MEHENPNEIYDFFRMLGAQNILLTMGNKGAWLLSGGKKLTMSAPKVKAINPAGAGACFSAGYLYGYMTGWEEEQCLKFATIMASFYVQGRTKIKLNDVLNFQRKLLIGDSSV